MSTREEKVAREVAEQEFDRWADAMDIVAKFDAEAMKAMDEDDRKEFFAHKRVLIDAIRFGHLVVNDAGEFVYVQKVGPSDPITFHEPKGQAFISMDKAGKQHHGVTKSFAVLAEMSGQPVQRFSLMLNRDVSVCQAIFVFLLGK